MNAPPCRLCGQPLTRTFVDLGMSPPSNALLYPDSLDRSEVFHPLHVRVCENCLLVQLPVIEEAEAIFTSDYAYFSSS